MKLDKEWVVFPNTFYTKTILFSFTPDLLFIRVRRGIQSQVQNFFVKQVAMLYRSIQGSIS